MTPGNSDAQPTASEERQADVGGAQQAGQPQTDRAGGAPEASGGLDADSPAPRPPGSGDGAGVTVVTPTDKAKDDGVRAPETNGIRRPGDGAAGQSSL